VQTGGRVLGGDTLNPFTLTFYPRGQNGYDSLTRPVTPLV